MPERIQMTRQRPWRAEHLDAVIVDRSTKWGNPFRVERATSKKDGPLDMWAVVLDHRWLVRYDDRADAVTDAVDRYRRLVHHECVRIGWLIRDELAGKDLACWCGLDEPCHGDVLLEIANG